MATVETKLSAPQQALFVALIASVEPMFQQLKASIVEAYRLQQAELVVALRAAVVEAIKEIAMQHEAPSEARSAPTRHNRDEPWRLSPQAFAEYSCEGNAKNIAAAKWLMKRLGRSTGHNEGQLYLDWAARVGDVEVSHFWKSRGFEQ